MSVGTLLSLLLLGFVAIGGASIVFYTLENGISPSPTPPRVRRALLDAVGGLDVSGTVCELGSGWGTLAFPLARLLPDHTVIGFENSPVPFACSALRLALSGLQNLDLKRVDFLRQDLSEAGLIIVYQSPGNMMTLRPKLEAELPDHAWVVSNTFAVPGWTPHQTLQVDDLYKTRIYLYQAGQAKPLRRK